ncbi:MAG: CPBP family intramembrane glutamic endopeptidase [Gammaproteobacteria bacterium]
MNLKAFAQRASTAFFISAAFVITYLIGIPIYLALQGAGVENVWVNNFVLRFGPALAGIATIALLRGSEGLRDLFRRCVHWRIPPMYFLTAILIQPAVLLATLVIRGHWADVQSLDPAAAIGAFAAYLLLTVLVGAGFGEEIGWRGFLQPQLSQSRSPLAGSLLLGITWFAWHVPAYLLDPGNESSDPILPFLAIIFPFSIVHAWAYFRSKGSILLPAVLHGAIDASWYTLEDVLPQVTGTPGFQPAFDWTIAVFWYVIATVILLKWGLNLGRQESQ